MRSRRSTLSQTLVARVCAAGAALVVVATAPSAHADDSPYCRKVRARASSDASILIAPSLRLEGIRIPVGFQRGNATVDPSSVGPEYQLRAGLTLSPIAMLKGFKVLDLGDADCEQHVTMARVHEVVAQGKEYGRAPALGKQIAYLDDQRSTWQTIETKGEQRFASNATTLQQVEEIRVRTIALERQRAQLAGEKERLESAGAKPFHGRFSDLNRSIEATSMDYEKKVSSVRKLDSWGVSLSGGYLPPLFGAVQSDYYGAVQLTHNLGGAWRNAAETRYVAARQDELKSSRSELASRLSAFRASLVSMSAQAARELQVLELRVAALTAGRAAMEGFDAVKAAHALALLDLELIAAESERTYLTELVRQLRTLEEN